MRSSRTPSLKTVMVTLFGAASVLVPAACGCGSSSLTSTPTTHTTTRPLAIKPVGLSEKVVVVAKSGAHLASSARVKSGSLLAFQTTVPAGTKSGPVEVKLTLSRGPARELTATASVGRQRSTATLTSDSGAPITIALPQYTCVLPPAPSFCPGRNARFSAGKISVQFKATPATPIVIAAIVGKGSAAAPGPPAGTLVAPAYSVTQSVSAHPTGAKPSLALLPSRRAAAKPGDVVVLRTRLLGLLHAAPQPLTVSFDQGPGTTLKVTGSVPGGAKSTATITSANGSRIALVRLQYTCTLPPVPSFCPAARMVASSHHYSLTFPASPETLVTIQGVAQAAG